MGKSGIDSETLLNIQKRVESVPAAALAQELQRNAQALVQQPRNPALQFGVGLLYARIGDYASATTVLERALKLSKNHVIILGVLAFIYANQIGDHQTAIKYLRKKIQADKRDSASYLLIAKSYLSLGKPEKALEVFNKANEFASGKMKNRLLAMRSQCYQRMGEFDLARTDLLALSEIEPTGLVSVADVLSRMPDNDPQLRDKLEKTMTQALTSNDSNFRDDFHKAMTAVAIANIRERHGDYAAAFDYFSMANELQGRDAKAWGYDETHEFEINKRVFDKEIFEKLPSGHVSDKQIFIVGMPRSGTTLLESILGANANVEDHGELDFFIQQFHRLGFTSEKYPKVSERVDLLRRLLLAAPDDGYKEIGEAYISQHGFDNDPDMIRVDKMPHNFRALGIIAATFPNARIIHARRHPIDICLSNFKNLLPGYNTTFGTELRSLGEFYIEYANLMRHWNKVLPIDLHEVRYEDIVTDTATHAKLLVEYCGIEWDQQSLENRASKSDVNTASMWQVRQDIYSSSVQKWRNYEAQLKPLIDILAEEIERYEADEQ